ncbi:hypothetical protein OQA88_8260 [Cercophora sp. LCS_1]
MANFKLMFGSASLSVHVVDENGNDVAGATVHATVSTHVGIEETTVTGPDGIAVFHNLPDDPISLLVKGEDNSQGVGSVVAGQQTGVTITMAPYTPPVPGGPNFDDNGLGGFNTGSSATSGTKRDLFQRAVELVLSTAGQSTVQFARKTFALTSDISSVYIQYMFQTNEVPAGFFGSKWNDYYSVSIRTNNGASVFSSRSMNELGLGAFNFDTGETGWMTTSLDIPSGANSVEFAVAVSNVGDNLYDSKIVVKKVGVCDKCASCSDCPALSKCSSTCAAPAAGSCSFYRSCLEETVKCESTGYALRLGEATCNKFLQVKESFSLVAQQFMSNSEQCMQQALVPLLSCESNCDAIEGAAFAAMAKCYVDNGFCSLKGLDYARLIAVLGEPYHDKLRQAAASQVNCVQSIFAAIDADTQISLNNAAAGINPPQNIADVITMTAARIFFLHVPNGAYLPPIDALAHVQQVYNTAVALSQPDPNVRVMDYFRYVDPENWRWKELLGVVNPIWIEKARQAGVVPYIGFQDQLVPKVNVAFGRLFSTMMAVYYHGEKSSIADVLGWMGHLFRIYGEWAKSGNPFVLKRDDSNPGEYLRDRFNSPNIPSAFTAENLRQVADGYNIGRRLRVGRTPDVVAAFKAVMEGGYETRIKQFFESRFNNDLLTAGQVCNYYMTTLNDPVAILARATFAGYVIPPPAIVTETFCSYWANRIATYAQSQAQAPTDYPAANAPATTTAPALSTIEPIAPVPTSYAYDDDIASYPPTTTTFETETAIAAPTSSPV